MCVSVRWDRLSRRRSAKCDWTARSPRHQSTTRSCCYLFFMLSLHLGAFIRGRSEAVHRCDERGDIQEEDDAIKNIYLAVKHRDIKFSISLFI